MGKSINQTVRISNFLKIVSGMRKKTIMSFSLRHNSFDPFREIYLKNSKCISQIKKPGICSGIKITL